MRATACFLSAFLCAGAYAQQIGSKPFDRWALGRVRTILDARLSPSGDQIAFVLESPLLTEDVYRADIHLIALSGGASRRVASEGLRNHAPSWGPDSLLRASGHRPGWCRPRWACRRPALSSEMASV